MSSERSQGSSVTLEREFVVATKKALNMREEILIRRYEFVTPLADKHGLRAPRSLHACGGSSPVPSAPALGCGFRRAGSTAQGGRRGKLRHCCGTPPLLELLLLHERNGKRKKSPLNGFGISFCFAVTSSQRRRGA